MTLLGWVFLAASLAFVWGLVVWCYWRVLTLPDRRDERVAEKSRRP